MANLKISELTAASSAVGTNEIPINEAGTTKKVTVSQVVNATNVAAAGAMMASTPTLLGGLNKNDFLVSQALHDYGNTSDDPVLAPGTDGDNLKVTVNDSYVFTITDPGVCCRFMLTIYKDATVTERNPTWPAGVKWLQPIGALSALTINAGKYIITFVRESANLYNASWGNYS